MTRAVLQFGLSFRSVREEEPPCMVVRGCQWVGKPPICQTPSHRQVTFGSEGTKRT